MSEETRKRDWIDLAFKLMTPIVTGILIAFAGWVANWSLSDLESKKENARLITELQVKREQAESDLRKDIFDQTLKSFLQEDSGSEDLRSQSKRLLRLELLALNFGDSLSLSPLFVEFKKDLESAEPVSDLDAIDHEVRVALLQKRLRSLAKKVAGTQLSSLEQHGRPKEITIHLDNIDLSSTCRQKLGGEEGYKWPDDVLLPQFPGKTPAEVKENLGNSTLLDETLEEKAFDFGKYKRYVTLTFSEVDHCEKSIQVDLEMKRSSLSNGSRESAVDEIRDLKFRLDYFNFPKVDNTRLVGNHRFAIVLEDFNLNADRPFAKITGVVFPSEYASLRDRPGMREALELLKSALDSASKPEPEPEPVED